MDVEELLKLKRPLTDEEAAYIEEQVLLLAKELQAEVAKITKHLDPSDPDVAKLRAAPAKIIGGIEAAINVPSGNAAEDASIARQKAEAVYD
jgi:hypothetical protein